METLSVPKGFALLLRALLARAFLVPSLLTLAALLAGAVAGPVAHAQAPEFAYDEAEAQSIDRMLMCPVCPAETIDQAQVQIAKQMRQVVREMLAQGSSREEILDFFAERYGPDILASPPKSGFNLVAWIFPIVGVAAALAVGLLVLRSMSARRASYPAAAAQPVDADLAPYLEVVDRETGRFQNPRVDAAASPGRRNGVAGNPATESTSGDFAEPGESDSNPDHVEGQREGGSSTNG